MPSATTLTRLEATLAPILSITSFPFFLLLNSYFSLSRRLRTPKWNPRGKTVLITGASSGIGESFALRMAQRGADTIILCARRKDELDRVGAACRAAGAPRVLCFELDVANDANVRRVITEQVSSQVDKIDLLVLNAGISMGEFVSDLSTTDILHKIMDVNYHGSTSVTVYALPLLNRSKTPKIAVVSSVLGSVAGPTRSGYAASKFALKGFFDALRIERPDIGISIVYPGVVKTSINRTRLGTHMMSTKDGMESSDAAELIEYAVRTGKRDLVYTLSAKFIWYLRDWVPEVRDWVVARAIKQMFFEKSRDA
ncbi:hypothetical protein HK104_007010 [Borealophlyctis nickersoniae]|nr:hypothetical protein HK104_007010 [Borealophlyctis nickersoniae]